MVQVTVARHMEMSAEDIGATLAYGCQKLVEEDLFFGQQNTNLASGCEKIIFIGKQHLVSFFCWVSFCEVHDAIWKV